MDVADVGFCRLAAEMHGLHGTRGFNLVHFSSIHDYDERHVGLFLRRRIGKKINTVQIFSIFVT